MRLPRNVIEAIDGAAAKGASRLDARRPNWYYDIDPKLLDMGDGCLCVCGQLYGGYGRNAVATVVGSWVKKLGWHRVTWGDVAERYGFTAPAVAQEWAAETYASASVARSNAVWNRLERAWKNEIRRRRDADALACSINEAMAA